MGGLGRVKTLHPKKKSAGPSGRYVQYFDTSRGEGRKKKPLAQMVIRTVGPPVFLTLSVLIWDLPHLVEKKTYSVV